MTKIKEILLSMLIRLLAKDFDLRVALVKGLKLGLRVIVSYLVAKGAKDYGFLPENIDKLVDVEQLAGAVLVLTEPLRGYLKRKLPLLSHVL